MTNPNNAVGTNAAFGGRTSPNAFNDALAGFTAGVVSGWACVPKSGLTVSIGGSGSVRDVAIAEDNTGNKTTINNITASPIDISINAAPGANTRIDAIVAYVDNPPQGSATVTDNYGACGIITVDGTASSTPVVPNDTAIRTAITADGATGSTAYYVVLAYVTMATGTTDITAGEISAGPSAVLGTSNIPALSATAINMVTSADTAGWRKIQLSSNVNLYLAEGSQAINMAGQTWKQTKYLDKPSDLNLSNTFFGGAGGLSTDHAINLCGFVERTNATVQMQTQNIYEGTVSTTAYWWAYIVEISS